MTRLARSYLLALASYDWRPDFTVLIREAIARSNSHLLAGFGRRGTEG